MGWYSEQGWFPYVEFGVGRSSDGDGSEAAQSRGRPEQHELLGTQQIEPAHLGLPCRYGDKFDAFRSWKLVLFAVAESGQALLHPENKMVGKKTCLGTGNSSVKGFTEGAGMETETVSSEVVEPGRRK